MNTNEVIPIEIDELLNNTITIDNEEIQSYHCPHKLIDNTIKDSCEICDLDKHIEFEPDNDYQESVEKCYLSPMEMSYGEDTNSKTQFDNNNEYDNEQ